MGQCGCDPRGGHDAELLGRRVCAQWANGGSLPAVRIEFRDLYARASVRGYVTMSTGVAVGLNDVSGIDFPTFNTVGQITGP